MTTRPVPTMGLFSKGVTSLAVGLLTFTLLSRALVLGFLPESTVVDEWLASDLFFHFHHAVDVWFLWIAFDLPILIGLPALVFLFRKKWFLKTNGQWELSAFATAMAWIFYASHHFMLDIQPSIASGLFLFLLTLPNPLNRWTAARPTLTILATLAISVACTLIESEGSIAALSIASYAAALLMSWWMASRFGVRFQWVLAIGFIGLIQVFVSLVPLLTTPAAATLIDTHRAYSFCESDNGSIYAAVTACYLHDSRYLVSEDCKREHVAEFSSDNLRLIKRHELSTPEYYGRMEFVRCIDDTLYVGGSDMTQNGENLLDSALSMNMTNPLQVQRNLVAAGVGHRSAYDAKRDALYFSGEFNDSIIRLDRQSGLQDASAGDWYSHPMLVLFALPIPGSLAFAPQSYHPERDALYAGEIFGDTAYGFNLQDHTLIQKYPSTGGIVELTVDAEQDRLYLANIWGMDVWDLKTGQRIKRMRLGTANRHPIIDTRHQLIYVPSTVTGRLFIVDRQSLSVLGSIVTGYGPRYGLITKDGSRLILSANSGTYSFDTQLIAQRVGRDKPVP